MRWGLVRLSSTVAQLGKVPPGKVTVLPAAATVACPPSIGHEAPVRIGDFNRKSPVRSPSRRAIPSGDSA